jgi:LuxR family transcriptional regulator
VKDLTAQLKAMTSARTVEDLWEMHTEKMATYGFDRLIYGFTRYITSSSLGNPQDWLVFTNMPASYMQVAIEEEHFQNGPMIRWALENDGACSWSWIAEQARMGTLSAAEMKMTQYNVDKGVFAGYTGSLRSVSERSKGGIALIARNGLTQVEVDKAWETHGDEIIVLNNVLHLKLLTLPHSGARRLTKRQREVLQWVGDGKTTQDIGILLGLTPATVEKHLRLAREALDVETTAQAVLKAAFYNQMFVIDL